MPDAAGGGHARDVAVHLVPIGALARARVEDLAARLSRRVSAACRAPDALSGPEPAPLPDRDQVDADALLARLEERALDPGTVLVGVTALDLAIPVFTFVFGRARAGGRAAVVSLARLDPACQGFPADPGRTADRAVCEIVHELGHVAGLLHCDHPECVMRFAGSVEKVDARGSAFCTQCAERLPPWLRGPRAGGEA